ncbi:MAG: hypothetical protein ACFFAO_14550 [Candidatus Hermodarchaeota archaeon]
MAKKLYGLRLSDENIKKLEIIAQNNNQSVNSVMKNAILEWLEIFFRVRKQGMIILGKSFLSSLLEFTDDEKIKPIAEMTAKRKTDFFLFILGKQLNKETLEDFIKFTPKILGSKGLMWFDHLEITKEESSVYIRGIHNLGETWSKFMLLFFKFLIEKNFTLIFNEENFKTTANSIFFEYTLKKK